MVNKIWCRKVARAWLQAKPEPPHPRAFSEPRCQNYIGAWYLAYRCFILAAWLVIIVCSIFELGSSKPIGNNHKWPIYLTNWDLLLGAAQASLGLMLVWKRWKSQTTLDFDANNMELGKTERAYWFLYTSTCTIAIGVTVSYWSTVYDPKIHQIDPLNIMLHVCNSLLMIADLCIMSIPLRLRHFWWCLTIVVSYILFSVIYYSAGGLDKRNLTYIYKVLDWQKPGRTLLVCLGGVMFLVVVHCLLCLVTRLRERFYARNIDKYVRESTNNSASEQSRQTVKQIEIV